MGPCGVLIQEIKESLFLNFICPKINYCPRECNSVADGLAAFGAKLSDVPQVAWPGYAPEFVHCYLASDLAVLVE